MVNLFPILPMFRRTWRLISLLLLLLGGVPAWGLPPSSSAFQPVLIALDPGEGRLYVAVPETKTGGTRLLTFDRLDRADATLASSRSIPGMVSGLSYDSNTPALFIASGSGHEVRIYDRPTGSLKGPPSRTLKRFNFPTGIYVDGRTGRLFVADAHPGSVFVFEEASEVDGNRSAEIVLGGNGAVLNGPFALAADAERRILYVSHFDGVVRFDLDNPLASPERLSLPPETLVRGMAFDPRRKRLYMAAPMEKSIWLLDSEGTLTRVTIEGVSAASPFSLAIDPEKDRLYLAGPDRKVGILEGAARLGRAQGGLEERTRAIDRWIQWKDSLPPAKPPARRKPGTEGVSFLGGREAFIRRIQEETPAWRPLEGIPPECPGDHRTCRPFAEGLFEFAAAAWPRPFPSGASPFAIRPSVR